MSNYSDLNSGLNYNKIIPYKTSEFSNYDETPSFSKFQEFQNKSSRLNYMNDTFIDQYDLTKN